jgi:hypothetical protein
MNRLFIPTLGPTDWRRLLADPQKHWERNRSALEMAVSWEAARKTARGLPAEVEAFLDGHQATRSAQLLMGIPEHQVEFVGGGHASQNDLWALLGTNTGVISMSVEAKAGESLGEYVKDWLPKPDEKSRKPERLEDLKRYLGLVGMDLGTIRYQLLHRTASALKEAERFRASAALMLIQSFSKQLDEGSLRDYRVFAQLMEAPGATDNRIVQAMRPTKVPLYLGWVSCEPANLQTLEKAV